MKVQIKLQRIFGCKIDRDRVLADEMKVGINTLDSAVQSIPNLMPKQTTDQSPLVRSL